MGSMNQVTITFYAHLKEKAGLERVDLQIPEGTTIRDLKQVLRDRFPELGPQLLKVMVLVNQRNIFLDDMVVPLNAQVAFLPPLSGG
jgi:molybdopterin converting factor small subunit